MPLLHAIVLGAVQGLTEFVPVSSSGHLVVVPEALGWAQPGLTFDVLLHIASLIALVVYFWSDLVQVIRGTFTGDSRARRLAMMLIIGTIPAAIAGVLLGDYFDRSFNDAKSSALQLIITAAILVAGERALKWRTERAGPGGKLRDVDDLRAPDATAIGVAQAIAILPGISRSGSTIAAGLGLGFERDDAARFAFLLAVPALAGAAVLKAPDIGSSTIGMGAAMAGFLTSLVTSYVAIAALIRYLKRNTVYPFAAYCVIAGIVFYFLV
ncbi:MAG: undecaprenyl-diphosphate phosphatase [Actinobacteria bacterium]|nr:undecaprenyl-diphosphate phosphatase [Actinomycetota bacterium]